MKNIPEFSVSEITSLTKNILEENFERVRIRGEVSKIKENKGHLYFSLKDENFILNAICWSSAVPLLQVFPEEGMEVVAEGKITTYAKSSISSYQIKVDQIELQGEGALLKLIEQRKKKLQAEGYFNEEHKKSIPFIPNKIGIITSPTGAVIMDIINRVQDRYPTHLLIYPISVQGNKSAGEIIKGIEFFNKRINVDTIIIARGGGGAEDLLSFNDENVVKSAFASKIPIISAIGHETDFTLLDLVADYRASTPTAAAEKAVPEKTVLIEKIFAFNKQLISNFNLFLREKDKNVYQLVKSLNINNLKNFIKEKKDKIKIYDKSLTNLLKDKFKYFQLNLNSIFARLDSLDTKKILKRGFSIIRDLNNNIIYKKNHTLKNNDVIIELSDGKIKAKIS
ncbi:MAG: exodeoxyribonuclease VII large subunit [Candidatus Fonsibacter ubiquis]|jgi:exodeoxyribonuclease VII large subunit|nr:exodeoxyribonuclease VII large subunit [Pseudomonadota bacterium]NCU45062.1 exodeoxyribonuclease VII large subunit [Candidatus Fonsibacter ubiquis]NCU45844.1 exodeoxyribonuclease VII large subunit [Candidatus Fonsibacter ubiquis]NCU47843.1 exodeoxyribonuclease VII large subunit [Candidatus Fonsibacter ubiquis]NCU51069.1 exodeoxyribonuclease VII large subunit [Candidatus Fonsibacter ubiquis]